MKDRSIQLVNSIKALDYSTKNLEPVLSQVKDLNLKKKLATYALDVQNLMSLTLDILADCESVLGDDIYSTKSEREKKSQLIEKLTTSAKYMEDWMEVSGKLNFLTSTLKNAYKNTKTPEAKEVLKTISEAYQEYKNGEFWSLQLVKDCVTYKGLKPCPKCNNNQDKFTIVERRKDNVSSLIAGCHGCAYMNKLKGGYIPASDTYTFEQVILATW